MARMNFLYGWISILPYIAYLILYGAFFAVIYSSLRLLPVRPRRWPKFHRHEVNQEYGRWYKSLLWLFRIHSGEDHLEEKRRLLAQCGLRWNVISYELWRRGLLYAVCAAGAAAWVWADGSSSISMPIWSACGLVSIMLLTDRLWLQLLSRRRAYRLVRDIYAVSQHLLYYADSRMNLHGKLQQCLPHTGSIRSEMEWLLNEWYRDPEEALRSFRLRLGTEDGYAFAETLNSIRMNDHASYYELMRQRLSDYKEKLDMYRDSRKETTSYLLFTLAGIPILFTFRVFLYPWVIEGQRLFDSLN
jgi:hypothetical protein